MVLQKIIKGDTSAASLRAKLEGSKNMIANWGLRINLFEIGKIFQNLDFGNQDDEKIVFTDYALAEKPEAGGYRKYINDSSNWQYRFTLTFLIVSCLIFLASVIRFVIILVRQQKLNNRAKQEKMSLVRAMLIQLKLMKGNNSTEPEG